jgi:uncharacterized membrane protein
MSPIIVPGGVSEYDLLLFLHITAAFLFLAGAVIAGALQLTAMLRSRPSEIALLLRLTQVAVILIAIGSIGVLVLGLWLASYLNYSFGDDWIVAAIVLWFVSAALGSLGGRTYRKAGELAEELAEGSDEADPRLRALVRSRSALVLSYLSTAAVIAVLVLMIWKPGSG